MRIGVLGTGVLAVSLGAAWVRAGHEVLVAGRCSDKALAAAARIGGATRAVSPREAVGERDAVLLAVSWTGLADILRAAGAAARSLAGTPTIDPTNAVEHGIGQLLADHERAVPGYILDRAPGAEVVKAFNLFPAEQWNAGNEPVTVPLAGDHEAALSVTAQLVRDAGARPAVFGSLQRARQLEETAGFVIGLTFAGIDPRSAIPTLPTPAQTP
jgi:8-hydroxy-5-deazaflavin:NADPH oxidoreductase